MAIISFALTIEEFLNGKKTVTRRDWSDWQFKRWQGFWHKAQFYSFDYFIHDAYDRSPRAGGKKIGEFRLTEKPYREKLKDMPIEELKAEGGMCANIEDYCRLIGKTPEDYVTVIRFVKI